MAVKFLTAIFYISFINYILGFAPDPLYLFQVQLR